MPKMAGLFLYLYVCIQVRATRNDQKEVSWLSLERTKKNWKKKRWKRRRGSVMWRPGGRKDIKCLLITTEGIPSSLFPSPSPFLCVRFALIHYSQAAAYWILTTWNSKDVEKHMWKHTERLINCDFCQKVWHKKWKEKKSDLTIFSAVPR